MEPGPEAQVALQQRPDAPLVMHQCWRDLLFLHWRIDPIEIQKTLPAGLTVHTFDGAAWLGLVPFYMEGIRPRFCPTVPGISDFLEMNVRTYVFDKNGEPGVWFYSLDASQTLAVTIAKRFFHLPYHRAAMSAEVRDGLIDYRCDRDGGTTEICYRGGSTLPRPEPGSLEFFLAERYLLFAHDEKRDRILRGQVHHDPYPLAEAHVEVMTEAATMQAGFDLAGRVWDHACFSPGVSVEIFGIEAIKQG